MMEGQRIPALIAALMGEGVSTYQIEQAVARVMDWQLGSLVSDLARPRQTDGALVRAFVHEQASRLERA